MAAQKATPRRRRTEAKPATPIEPIEPADPLRRKEVLNRAVGEHIRWIREAYDMRQPLHHGLNQWADWLGVDAGVLSRVERGEVTPSPDLLNRVCFFSGASIDFLFWRVLSPVMDEWLIEALRTAHPTMVVEMVDFQRDRLLMLKTTPLSYGPRQRRSGALLRD